MLTIDDCDCVNYLLLLIRNILHAPERPAPNPSVDNKTSFAASNVSLANSNSRHPTTDCSQQNLLLKDLFGQGLDRLLINLLSTSQKVIYHHGYLIFFSRCINCKPDVTRILFTYKNGTLGIKMKKLILKASTIR